MGAKSKKDSTDIRKNQKRCRATEKAAKTAHKSKTKKNRLGGFLFSKMAKGGAAELRSNADEVNRLNVFPVPDGDTGDNMRMTIESGITAIENLNSDNLAEVMRVLSHGMLLGARGNSGVILSQFFAGVAMGFENADEADVEALGEALKRGVKQAYSTVVTPTEGTILTVAREAVDFAVSKITPKTTIKSFFGNLVSEMYASLERTPELLPNLKAAGVVDSGGAGLFYIMDGFRRVLNGEELKSAKTEKDAVKSSTPPGVNIEFEDGVEFFYCTETLVKLLPEKLGGAKPDTESLREQLSELGDSVATVLADGILKAHVHTRMPERVLGLMHGYGEFLNVKIENMTLQELENSQKSEYLFTKSASNNSTHRKSNAVVAVSYGDGISTIFRELGADVIIKCANAKNPSARDFIEAFEQANAENVFVLPNNSNILLCANQAANIYEKARVTVIETKSIGMGYAALAAFDHEISDTDAQMRNVTRELSSICDGYVSPSVRDAEIDGIKIKRGDTIGIVGKRIAVCKKSVSDCAAELASILTHEKSHLTFFYGEDVSEKEALKLSKKIKTKVPFIEIYSLYGGQETYPYIFVAR